MIAIDTLMTSLARRRPVFWSEADFQHELALELRTSDPDLHVRLEYPLGVDIRGAVDILILAQDPCALELKYLCKGLNALVGDEQFTLRHQGAHDIRRYDVCKDVARMERYAERTGHAAGVLVLTNEPAYWQPRRRADTADAAFNLADLSELSGRLIWSELAGEGTMRGRTSPIELANSYPLAWRDYSDVGGVAGRFRYLWIPTSNIGAAN